MSAFCFDRMPYLCMEHIFSFFNLRTLTKCRAVCGQFKFYADRAQLNNLVLTRRPFDGSSYYDKPEHWYLIDTLIDSESYITLKQFSCSPLRLNQVKFLRVTPYFVGADLLEFLNAFKQLVHLEIGFLDRFRQNTLHLPKLELLKFDTIDGPFILKTPKLEILASNNPGAFQIEQPESVKRIDWEFSMYEPACDLKNFKSLKVLNLVVSFKYREWHYERFRTALLPILDYATAASRKEQLKLYLGQVRLLDAKQLPDEHLSDKCFWLNNYRLLRRNFYPAITRLNYNKLTNVQLMSDEFFVRFPRIEHITITGPVERDPLNWFLNHANALRSLRIANISTDSQMLLNDLPNLNLRLARLEVNGSSDLDLVINFNFILQLRRLQVLETNLELGSLDLATVFDQLNLLSRLVFRSGDERGIIDRVCSTNICRLSCYKLKNNEASTQTFHQQNLKLAEMLALYHQRGSASVGEKRNGIDLAISFWARLSLSK